MLSTCFPYCASRSFPSPTCHFTPLLSHTLFHLPAMPLNGKRNPPLSSSSSPLLQQDSGQALPPPGKPSTHSSTRAAPTTSKGTGIFIRAQIHRPWGLEGPRRPRTHGRAGIGGVSGRAGREKNQKVKSPGACRSGRGRASWCLILSNMTVLVILLPPLPSPHQHGVSKATLSSAYYVPGSGPSILQAHSL